MLTLKAWIIHILLGLVIPQPTWYFHSHKSMRAQCSSLVSLASLQACCAIPACVQPTCCPEEKQRQSHTQIPLLGSAPALCAKHWALHLSGEREGGMEGGRERACDREREGGNGSRFIISDVYYASYCDFRVSSHRCCVLDLSCMFIPTITKLPTWPIVRNPPPFVELKLYFPQKLFLWQYTLFTLSHVLCPVALLKMQC